MFILNLSPINRNIGGPQQPVPSPSGKDADGAFQEGMKGNGYDQGELNKATSDRTRLSRSKRTELAGSKRTNSRLFNAENDGSLQEEAVYRTVMVDGMPFTLRLLAVA